MNFILIRVLLPEMKYLELQYLTTRFAVYWAWLWVGVGRFTRAFNGWFQVSEVIWEHGCILQIHWKLLQ